MDLHADEALPATDEALPATVPTAAAVKEGDYVYGRVIFTNDHGCRVQLMFSHDGMVG